MEEDADINGINNMTNLINIGYFFFIIVFWLYLYIFCVDLETAELASTEGVVAEPMDVQQEIVYPINELYNFLSDTSVNRGGTIILNLYKSSGTLDVFRLKEMIIMRELKPPHFK